MAKGFFTQCMVILLKQPVSIQEMEQALASFDIRKRLAANEHWEFGGPSLVIAHRPECNGALAVDTVDRSWPDHMGDPKEDPMLFACWSMGHFGPLTYPGGLKRASQQAWQWEPAKSVADRHVGFIRIRYSYAFGAAKDSPIIPRDYDPLVELEFVTKVALALMTMRGALCYFNPNGELLLDQETMTANLDQARSQDLTPIDVWTNVRLFSIDPRWSLMDTVGNGQFDTCDCEAVCDSERYDLGEVATFLRNASLYLLQNGNVIRNGDTMDGPGSVRWQARSFENGICDPPRSVLRWIPMDGDDYPPEILGERDGASAN